MSQIYPILIVYIKEKSTDPDWVEGAKHTLKLPVIRIGRSQDNEIKINLNSAKGSLVSRHQGTMFKQIDQEDYEYLDGTIEDVTVNNIQVKNVSSRSGTAINGKRLDSGQKVLLKDGDRITIIENRLELIYRHYRDTSNDSREELTYVPELEENNATELTID